MCEHYIARSAEPFQLRDLWPFTDRLERYGLAGFGWGAAWIGGDGELRSHRDVRAFRDDGEGARTVGLERTTAALVHLRRPSKLSTMQLPDAQPFDDPVGRYSFSHNGDLRDYRSLRREYQDQGRIFGRADTEVGVETASEEKVEGAVLHFDGDRNVIKDEAYHALMDLSVRHGVLKANDPCWCGSGKTF